jgi:group II intron reverse transcriptase/maturase
MYGREQSDRSVVPRKAPNKADEAAEELEGRDRAEENAGQQNAQRTQSRASAPSALDRVRQVAREDRTVRFTALLHHVNIERLRESYQRLKPRAAPGVDGVMKAEYGKELERNLQDLVDRVHRGGYRAKPSRRKMIPKGDGGERPLGIASLEDKILQGAVAEVLNAIYEEDFLGFSYGFRGGRSQHKALDALAVGICGKKVNWVLDADIRGFFDSIDHGRLIEFVEHRIADGRLVRLIQKWLRAGVMLEEGLRQATTEGTPQGATISPLLANVYLHYVFDLWAHDWRQRHASGDVVIVRYADDFLVGFQHQAEARRFLVELKARLAKFALQLHPDKTRLIEFGRFAATNRKGRGEGKPETFDFLGFTHVCGQARNGGFQLQRKTIKKRLRNALQRIKDGLRTRMHDSVSVVGTWLRQVLRGYFNYYAVPTNSAAIRSFRTQVARLWCASLRKRSQRHRWVWARFACLAERWLPPARISHPWPTDRFLRQHPRQEPSAVAPLAGICAGGAR